jgi:hypothetical protein
VLDPRAAYKAAAPPRRGPLSVGERLDGGHANKDAAVATMVRALVTLWLTMVVPKAKIVPAKWQTNNGTNNQKERHHVEERSKDGLRVIEATHTNEGNLMAANQQQPSDDKKNQKRHGMRRFLRMFPVHDWLVALFTGILVCVAIQQNHLLDKANTAAESAASAARETVNVARDTARTELRAYMGIDKATWGHLPDLNASAAILTVKNFGNTPAHDVVIKSCCMVRGFPSDGPFKLLPIDEGLQTTSKNMTGPGNEFTQSVVMPVDATQLALLKSGHLGMWTFGEITYKDAFGAEHKTTFRFIIGGDAGVPPSDSSAGMTFAPDGNTAD